MMVREFWFREELDEVPGILALDEEAEDWDEEDFDDEDEDWDEDEDEDEDDEEWEEWEEGDEEDLGAGRGGRPTWNLLRI